MVEEVEDEDSPQHIKMILRGLPATVPWVIKKGLLDMHEKLSDYYHKFDESPFYTWAACKWLHCGTLYQLRDRCFPVLDPWISYEGMKLNYENDLQLAEYLQFSKKDLHTYYESHYANQHSAPSQMIDLTSQTVVSSAIATSSHSPQKNFTSHFHRKTKAVVDELEEYFKLPAEDFESCNPIHWWMGRRAQFQNLFWLTRDLLCIPGK